LSMIVADQVSKWYGEVVGLNKYSVDIGSGITGLVGPNGAGKTTFIRLLTGQMQRDNGSLHVLGEDPFDNPSLMKRIGYCPEHESLYFSKGAVDFLTSMAMMHGYGKDDAVDRAYKCLDIVGLEVQKRPIGTYSKGMKQRVKIAQALLHDPELLILDEPFGGVDPVIRVKLFELISGLAKKGMHVVLSSHILYEVERLAPSVVLMSEGKMILQGDISHILDIVEDYTHSIILHSSRPGELGAALMQRELVHGADIQTDNNLLVKTKNPSAFYGALPDMASKEGFDINGVLPVDNDLQAIFDRVVKK